MELPIVSESVAKVLAATSISQSLSFCMEIKYLEKIDDVNMNPYFALKEVPVTSKNNVSWLEITQIGKPLEQTSEDCFSAMQKILYSCFMPKETQLLFLITGNGKYNRLYLGVRPTGNGINPHCATHIF